ncbi:uncharacterized protein BT62DRAFT_1077761 [Guyanagaster necrorhizus]|uniref:Uncharacterized protein n=1 Tax=Guyanagaster necrorhizus TaxID=856835 RepID=A0A9P7VNG0_9AGAR|nr:uncharacterized protein BT62DRAFT_1077761 [Guyanagaster necrorhizus MCA 3950]KAG7444418.1 hypothetical protein BT62DRAFT_1077761 [Guyanagaster necrorhizus MCA 3950]
MSQKAHLIDSDGKNIENQHYYKIRLADGSELGYAPTGMSITSAKAVCAPMPSNAGALFRFVPKDDSKNGVPWTVGDVGYLKGLQSREDGTVLKMNLTLSTGSLPALGWYDSPPWGFTGKQLAGNRIALYARNKDAKDVGLVVVDLGRNESTLVEDRSGEHIPLDCQFVRMAPITTKF